jgi:hypothetical protein
MDVPILGQKQPGYSSVAAHNQSDVTQAFQLYDSEIEAALGVLATLRGRSASRCDLEAFNREIHQRFEEIGLVVQVKWFETNVEDTYASDIDIVGRTEEHVFDHDKMVHQVVHDILQTGDSGVIKSGDFLRPEPHKH